MTLGKNILKTRKEKGLSQEKLGEKLNVSRQTISNWELGITSPNLEQLKLISKELNLNINNLLNENNTIEINQEYPKTKEKLNTWKTIFLVIGAPIWISLLITIFSIFLSIYIALWSVIICFWAIFGSMIGSALTTILVGILFVFSKNKLTGLAMIGAGMICIGLSILIFIGCKSLNKGIILLTKKLILYIKNYFSKNEVTKWIKKQNCG